MRGWRERGVSIVAICWSRRWPPGTRSPISFTEPMKAAPAVSTRLQWPKLRRVDSAAIDSLYNTQQESNGVLSGRGCGPSVESAWLVLVGKILAERLIQRNSRESVPFALNVGRPQIAPRIAQVPRVRVSWIDHRYIIDRRVQTDVI